jgi:hypothetical protein
MRDQNEIPFSPGLRLLSFDIGNMYSNIPTDELLSIIKLMRTEETIDMKITNELMNITHTIPEQNYFKFPNQRYIYIYI